MSIPMKEESLEVIIEASKSIDEELAVMTKENRGKCAKKILKFVRDINDHMANIIWQEEKPEKPMELPKAANRITEVGGYRFIYRLDKFTRKFIGHCTPDEDGAQRLLIKYYPYLLEHKKIAKQRFDINILGNVDMFLDDIDEQTLDYYKKVLAKINYHERNSLKTEKDNYYINKKKAVYIKNEVFYEIALEPADEKPNKFNRITAFTKFDIMENYCVALSFVDDKIEAFNIDDFPIKIITSWEVSIRPCEVRNFAKILNYNIRPYERSNAEYSELMSIIKDTGLNLVEIIDQDEEFYQKLRDQVINKTKDKFSKFFNVLDEVRRISKLKQPGYNILRYLLYRLNNRIIRWQWPTNPSNIYCNYYLHSGCRPFDEKPISFDPKSHIANIHDVIEAVDIEDKQDQFLARKISINTDKENKIFTPISELQNFGSENEIKELINRYNSSLYGGFRPECEIGIFNSYLYNKGYENYTYEIIDKIRELSNEKSLYYDCFTEDKIDELKNLKLGIPLDDPEKESILRNMYSDTRIQFIYGAAGTGKSTLINYVTKLMHDKKKLFLAKTHPAVENLKQRITCKEEGDEFATIDSFVRSDYYHLYDLIVVDECSTVKNEEILKILQRIGNGIVLLTGDVYQIEAIGFGNWFKIEKYFIKDNCSHDLVNMFRSHEQGLKDLWKEVREMNDENVVIEDMVLKRYSHIIDNSIFETKDDDEIILCLNYNGLYGLNNINTLIQLSNPNPFVSIGVWRYKKGDKILFNDSNRFSSLYNNLKGRIVEIEDHRTFIRFTIKVNAMITAENVKFDEGLELVETNEEFSIVKFNVFRHEPYYSDNENDNLDYIMPFQIAYAVSIHKSQGLEYNSVKIVIADDSEDQITHNIFYTAITRAKKYLTIYWSPEVCERIVKRIRPRDSKEDYNLLTLKHNGSGIVNE